MSRLKFQDPSISAMLTEFSSHCAMMTPFRRSFQELEDGVDRLERDGVCSEQVAEAARQEIRRLLFTLDVLILKKIEIQQRFRVQGTP
jgi:hypothetical protein